MTNLTHALRGASWLGIFKLLSQVLSWTGTIFVTRLLTSEDYGVMEMATVFTGYITFFVEFGVGTALVNKKSVTRDEQISAFWCMSIWGILLSLTCLVLAPITAAYFNEPRIDPLTRSVGLLFIFGSLSIVPRSILQKELRFKELGMIEVVVTFASVIFSVTLAYLGAGTWTLIGSYIFREFLSMLAYFLRSGFRPTLHFCWAEILPLLNFGLPVVISSSLYYLYTKADRFFGGGVLGAELLGFYAVALQLAAIPVEKIVTLIQGVLYPTLCKVKDEPEEFRKIYLCFISLIAFVTFPIYISGYLLANDLINLVLGQKWAPAIPSFKLLLIGQLAMAISSPNTLIHLARGKPKWNLVFNLLLTPALVLSFWYSSHLGALDTLALPWTLVYPVFTLGYILITNREVHIGFKRYLCAFSHPFFATLLVGIFLFFSCKWLIVQEIAQTLLTLGILVLGSIVIYVGYFLTLGLGYAKFIKSIVQGNSQVDYF